MQSINDILNDVQEVEEIPSAETVEVSTPPPEAETGVKQEEVPPTPEKTVEERMVPLKAMEDVRHKWQEAQARIQQLESRLAAPEPKKTPDVFEDPEGYTKHMESALQQATFNERCNISQFLAKRDFPDLDAKTEIFANLVQQYPQYAEQVRNSPSPYHEMADIVNKHEKLQKMENLDQYEADLKAKFRAEFEAEMQAKAALNAESKAKKDAAITPNLTKARSTAPVSFQAEDSLDELLRR